jgi:hypothetical protein
MNTLKVRYVGKKDQETDHLYGTGITWVGLGDVHEVPLTAWAGKMSRHPDVWEVVEEDSKPTGLSSLKLPEGPGLETNAATARTTTVDLTQLHKDALQALAKERGIKVHPNAGTDVLRAKLSA